MTYGEDNFFLKPSGDGRTTVELSGGEVGCAVLDDEGGEAEIVAHGEENIIFKHVEDGMATKEPSGGRWL